MSQAIISEMEEEVTVKRRELLTDLQDLRYAWANVMNGARAFMAFRNKQSIDEFNLYIEQSGLKLDKIAKDHVDILTFEQTDAIEQITVIRKQFIKNFEKTKEIHGGDKWRTDIYLVRTELGLTIAKIKRNLSILVEKQRHLIESESQSLLSFVSGTKVFVYTMLVVGMALGFGLAWAVSFMVTCPLSNAVNAMKDISEGEGDLTLRLNVSGTDEIGQLAESFNCLISKVKLDKEKWSVTARRYLDNYVKAVYPEVVAEIENQYQLAEDVKNHNPIAAEVIQGIE